MDIRKMQRLVEDNLSIRLAAQTVLVRGQDRAGGGEAPGSAATLLVAYLDGQPAAAAEVYRTASMSAWAFATWGASWSARPLRSDGAHPE